MHVGFEQHSEESGAFECLELRIAEPAIPMLIL